MFILCGITILLIRVDLLDKCLVQNKLTIRKLCLKQQYCKCFYNTEFKSYLLSYKKFIWIKT